MVKRVWGVVKYLLLACAMLVVVTNLLLVTPYVQDKIVQLIEREASSYLGSQVEIERIQNMILGDFDLRGVLLRDQAGDTLVYAKKIGVGVELSALLYSRIELSYTQLIGVYFHVSKDSINSPTNLQFLVDKFAKKETVKKEFNYVVNLRNLVVRNGHLVYHVHDQTSSAHSFSPHNIDITRLNANIALREFSKDSVDLMVKRISFKERSGIELNKLSIHLAANRSKAQIANFVIDLNRSSITVDSLLATYAIADSTKQGSPISVDRLHIASEKLYLSDFSPFVTQLSAFTTPLEFSLEANGKLDSLSLKEFHAHIPGELSLLAEAEVLNLPHLADLSLVGFIRTLELRPKGVQNLYAALNSLNPTLPHVLKQVGTIRFSGDVSGSLTDQILAKGSLQTDAGSIATNIKLRRDRQTQEMFYKGEVETGELRINHLLPAPNPFGIAAFKVEVDAITSPLHKPHGKVKGSIRHFDYLEYGYEDLEINAAFDQFGYRGEAMIDDPNIDLSLSGSFDITQNIPQIDVQATVNKLHLDKLNLTNRYPNSNISFSLNSKVTVVDQIDFFGFLKLQNLLFITPTDRLFYSSIDITSEETTDGARSFRIDSDLIHGELKGNFKVRDIYPTLQQIVQPILPSLMAKKPELKSNNLQLDYRFEVAETAKLTRVLQLPATLIEPVTLSGWLHGTDRSFNGELHAPHVVFGKSIIKNGQLFFYEKENQLNLEAYLSSKTKSGQSINLSLFTEAKSDSATTKVMWNNTAISTMSGEVKILTTFLNSSDQQKGLTTRIDFFPTNLIVSDTLWTLDKSSVLIDKSLIHVDHFSVAGNNQHLRINGKVSKNEEDTLHLSLKDISLDYVFDILKIPNLSFGGGVTGDFKATNLFVEPAMFTNNLEVNNFAFNNALLGTANIRSFWNNEQQSIHFQARVSDENDSISVVDGLYRIPNDSLNIAIQASQLNVVCLRPFLQQILVDLTGKASGNVVLYGPSKYLSLLGEVKTHEVNFGVDILNTRYTVSDSIHLKSDGIEIRQAVATDKFGNKAYVDGAVNYRYFKDIAYNFHLQTDNLFCYDRQTKDILPIVGSVFASGTVDIVGDESATSIVANVRSEVGSNMRYSIADNNRTSDYQYITFVTPQDVYQAQDSIYETLFWNDQPEETPKASLPVNLVLQMSINPNLQVEVVMDEVTGDIIKSTGSGDVRLEYNTRNNDLRAFGTYTIERGSYTFSLQNVITKNFTILEGSTISVNGRSFSSIALDVKAAYTTSANLTDLDESFRTQLSRTTLPVQCLMHITGNISRPALAFDVSVPSQSSDFNRRVKNLISSDDMMNRQIIYLLVLGKFYTPEYMNISGSRGNEMAALASSAVSSQLNNLLGKMIDNWNFGTNFRSQKGDFSDLEVELALQGQLLNNRLLINGNFGYREKSLNLMQTSFISDIDVEYLLNRSGSFRIKAYTHTNDRPYYFKPALTTQGLGFAFKKDINTIRFPFRKRKTPFVLFDEKEDQIDMPVQINTKTKKTDKAEN